MLIKINSNYKFVDEKVKMFFLDEALFRKILNDKFNYSKNNFCDFVENRMHRLFDLKCDYLEEFKNNEPFIVSIEAIYDEAKIIICEIFLHLLNNENFKIKKIVTC